MSTAKGPISEFIEKISKNWGLSFNYSKIWAIQFSKPSNISKNLGESIYEILGKYDDINNFRSFLNSNSNIYRDLLSSEDSVNIKISGHKHFILANKVSIPNESVYIGSTGMPNQSTAGGVIWGRFGGSRHNDPNKTLDITFLDTNREFTEYVIKPWIIAVAHRGLVETSTLPSLKSDISALFFAKSSPNGKVLNKSLSTISNYPQYYNNQSLKTEPFTWVSQSKETQVTEYSEKQPFLRKIITFKNCVPVSIPEKNYNYASEIGNDEVMTDVKFSYEYYTITSYNDIGSIEKPSDLNKGQLTTPEENITTNSQQNQIDNILKDLYAKQT